jgi:heat shock protein HslJ
MPVLEGVVWQLESYVDQNGESHPALADNPATLIFEDGKFISDTHCNSVSGAYSLDGNAISTQLGPSTLRACQPDIASQESAIMYGMSHAASYKIENDKLMLMDADGHELLTFTQQDLPELAGSTWQLLSFNNGDGMESNQVTQRITITFGEDGKVSGNAGCNHFSGSYQTDNEHLVIGPLATTRKLCNNPEGVMQTEQAFLDNLGQADAFSVMGRTLTIYDKDGVKRLVFTFAENRSITSIPWRLQSFNNGKGGMSTTVSTSNIYAIFGEDGRVTGNAGCNTFSGNYQIDDDRIRIDQIMATELYCADSGDIMETENAFFMNLSQAATFNIINDTLTLFNDEGNKLLVFVPGE